MWIGGHIINGRKFREEEVMAREGRAYLDVNDAFPKMELQLVSGETLMLPEGLGEGYGVVLWYRGYW